MADRRPIASLPYGTVIRFTDPRITEAREPWITGARDRRVGHSTLVDAHDGRKGFTLTWYDRLTDDPDGYIFGPYDILYEPGVS